MKVIILKNNFKKGLEIIGRITTESIQTLPILKNILIETNDNQIKYSSTNLELAISTIIPGKVIESGGITIPLALTTTIINNITSERIHCEVEGTTVVLQTDNYHAKLQGVKKDEFPIIPEINKENKHIQIKSVIIKNALQSVMGSAHINDTKPELHGVLMNVEGGVITYVATDGVRLAEKKIPATQFKTTHEEKIKIIIPLKTIQEVVRIINPEEYEYVDIHIDQTQILFIIGATTIISRLVSGEFPEYQGIIPQKIATEVIINKEQLLQALKLVSSFSDRLNEIKIIVKEQTKSLEIYSYNQSLGENQYLIPAKIKSENTPTLEIIFNWKFLGEGIRNIHAENVVMGLSADNKPAVIKSQEDHSYAYIVMPIKSL